MLSAIRFTISDVRIRAIALALVLLGFTYASTIPYQSIIGTQQLGMSERQFGLLIFVIGLAGMIGNLVLGYLSDLAKDRKTAILYCLGAGVVGFGSFALWPSMATFIFCMVFVLPFSNSAYALLFGTVRGVANEHHPKDAASINAAVRAFYAFSWIVVPGLVGLFIATRQNVSDCYAVAAVAFALCLLFYWRFGPSVPGGVSASASAVENLAEAFKLIFNAGRLSRLLAIALINSATAVSAYTLPLLINVKLGGSFANIGWLSGLVAAMEIPIMLGVGAAARRWPLWQVIVAGGLVHAGFLLALAMTTQVSALFAFAILNAIGNAVALTQHITYSQNLLPDRPGLGSSLMSFVALISRGLGAVVFAGIGAFYSLTGSLVIGTMVVLVGCLALAMMDARRAGVG